MKQRLFFVAAIWAAAILARPAFAVVHVAQSGAADFTSIQVALDSTPAGEEIIVTDQATYAEGLFVRNKKIVSDPPGATIAGAVTIDGDGPTTVTGFKISPAANTPDFYIVHTTATAVLSNLTITSGDGIIIEKAKSVTINDCTIANVTNHSLNIVGPDTDNLVLTVNRTQISHSGAFALALQREAAVTFKDCGLYSNGQAGIIITDTAKRQTGRPIIIDNTLIENNATAGILVQRACDVTVRNGCKINNNPVRGINWDGSTVDGGSLTIQDSSVTNSRDGGVFIARNLDCTFAGSTFTGNNYGFYRDYEYAPTLPTHVTMTSCTIANSTLFGFKDNALSTTHVLELSDNIIRDNAQEAVLLIGSQPAKTFSATLKRNKISGTTVRDLNLVMLINLDAGTSVVNNVLDSGRSGLTLSNAAADVYHNTIVGMNDGNGLGIEIVSGGSLPIRIVNNLFDRNGVGVLGAGATGLDQLSVDYNLINSVQANDDPITAHLGTHNVLGQAGGFVGASTTPGQGDYRLATGSAAINMGVASLNITEDLRKMQRLTALDPFPDAGAYEWFAVSAVSCPWIMY